MTLDPADRDRARSIDPVERVPSVAVVIPEPTTHVFEDPFFPLLLRGISSALADQDLQLVLLMPQSLRQLERAEAFLASGNVDGVLLVSLHGDDPLANKLLAHDLPIVVSGVPPRGARVSFVDSDNREGGRLATNHLLSLGRRKIATISGNLDMGSALDRLLGYREALSEAGIAWDPSLEEVADYRSERALTAMERLLLNHPDVDAVFAASDLMATAALRVLQQARRRVPEDVAVVGYDDSNVALMTHPTLTSVRQPIQQMGLEMVRLLVTRMKVGPEAEPDVSIFPTELIVRESTGGTASA